MKSRLWLKRVVSSVDSLEIHYKSRYYSWSLIALIEHTLAMRINQMHKKKKPYRSMYKIVSLVLEMQLNY
jgi:hypothetical protein